MADELFVPVVLEKDDQQRVAYSASELAEYRYAGYVTVPSPAELGPDPRGTEIGPPLDSGTILEEDTDQEEL